MSTPKQPTTSKEEIARETARVSKFHQLIAAVPFASEQDRYIFAEANLPKCTLDAAGNLLAKSKFGQVDAALFIQGELQELPNLLAQPVDKSAAQPTAAAPRRAAQAYNVHEMSTAQLFALTPEQKSQALLEALRAVLRQ
jgi:hypothetical protein